MKTLAITLITLFFITESPKITGFCRGFEIGYTEGWNFNQDLESEPLIPLCPLPHINKDTYTDGYNRGFVKGKADNE